MLAQMRRVREQTEARNDEVIRGLEKQLREARAKKAQELEDVESRTRDETARLRSKATRTDYVQTVLRTDYEAWEKKLRTPEKLDSADVALLLRELSIPLDLENFTHHGITGTVLLSINKSDFEAFGVTVMGDKLHLSRAIQRLKERKPLTHMLLTRRTEANSTLAKDELPKFVRDWTTEHLLSFISKNVATAPDIKQEDVPAILGAIKELKLDGDDVLEVAESQHEENSKNNAHVGFEIRAAVNLKLRANFVKVAQLVESSPFCTKVSETPYATQIAPLDMSCMGLSESTAGGLVRTSIRTVILNNPAYVAWEASRQRPEFSGTVPSDLVCPLTHQIYQDPVRADDHYVYERAALEAWLSFRNTSPITNQPMNAASITPSAFKLIEVQKFLAANPAEARLDE